MKFKSLIARLGIVFALCFLSYNINAQSSSDSITKIILGTDSLFWNAYNNCDIDNMIQYVTDDVEFYHDKNGILIGKENFKAAFQKNLCGNNNYRLRREPVKNSINVFLLKSGDTLYGALITGQHLFYVSDSIKKERLDGIAKFTNLWMLKNGNWKMSIVLSYDHGPAPYMNSRKEIHLTIDVLNMYAGKYNSIKNGIITIQPQDLTLALLVANQKFILYPESTNIFFTKERDLTFEFVKNEKNKITKMIVHENGAIAEEDERIK